MRTDHDAMAMRDALDALEESKFYYDDDGYHRRKEAAIAHLEAALAALPRTSNPVIHAKFEVVCAGATDSTDAFVKRVEVNGDGSYTAVIDHWPGSTRRDEAPEAVPAHQSAQPEPVSANSTLTQQAMSLYKPPFRFHRGYIWDTDNKMVADDDAQDVALRVRGWGAISYKPDAEALQDEVGRLIAEALTQYWQATAPAALEQGIKMGLEAAAQVCAKDIFDGSQHGLVRLTAARCADAIRKLDPAIIVKEGK